MFWVEDMQDHNIFGCKIYSEAIFLVLNFTLHTHSPVYKYNKYLPGTFKLPLLVTHDDLFHQAGEPL